MSLYGENRQDHRQIFFEVWRKQQNHEPLDPLEKKILSILIQHPEYHFIFANPEKFIDTEYFPELGETNPYLHLSLHLTVLEQIQTNQPLGITALYQQTVAYFQDVHEAEHCIMDSLAKSLYELMRENKPFDEKAYFERISIALKNGYW